MRICFLAKEMPSNTDMALRMRRSKGSTFTQLYDEQRVSQEF